MCRACSSRGCSTSAIVTFDLVRYMCVGICVVVIGYKVVCMCTEYKEELKLYQSISISMLG